MNYYLSLPYTIPNQPVSCMDVQKALFDCCKLDLVSVKRIQSFYATRTFAETVAEFNDWINHFFRPGGVESTGSTKNTMIFQNDNISIRSCALFGGIVGIVAIGFFMTRRRITMRQRQNQNRLTNRNFNTQHVNYSTF